MKIGQLVKYYAGDIFAHCEENPDELVNLMDWEYSNRVFDLMHPFCAESNSLTLEESRRYWKVPQPGFAAHFVVCGKQVRVTSQWYNSSRGKFVDYLVEKGIIHDEAQAENLSLSRRSAAGQRDRAFVKQEATEMNDEIKTVLNRMKRDIAWLENHIARTQHGGEAVYASEQMQDGKDYTRYRFKGQDYGKGRLVLAVVRDWCKENHPQNLAELNAAFPQRLTGVGGQSVLFMPVAQARDNFKRKLHRRHIMTGNSFDTVRTDDGEEYAVSSQWRPENIRRFLDNARDRLGYQIEEIRGY